MNDFNLNPKVLSFLALFEIVMGEKEKQKIIASQRDLILSLEREVRMLKSLK